MRTLTIVNGVSEIALLRFFSVLSFMTSNLLKSYLVAILKLCNSQIDFQRLYVNANFKVLAAWNSFKFSFFPFTAIWLLLHDVLIKNWKMNSHFLSRVDLEHENGKINEFKWLFYFNLMHNKMRFYINHKFCY